MAFRRNCVFLRGSFAETVLFVLPPTRLSREVGEKNE